jgi:hypothetical protein
MQNPSELRLRKYPQCGSAIHNCGQLIKTLTKTAIAVLLAGNGALAQPPGTGQELDTITVEAQRKHDQLQHEVQEFVDSALLHNGDESNAKWVIPICPLVAGLSKDQGEFLLTGISSIANTAGARLASGNCDPNLLVVVTNEPDRLLAGWNKHNPSMFAKKEGMGEFKRFLKSPRPVRVWYNAEFLSGFFRDPLSAMSLGSAVVPENHHARDTRLEFGSVRAIITAVVIVDRNQLANVNFGQLSDYVSLLALAEINLDKDHGNAPSILNLFTNKGRAPADRMSSWDEAFLKALYGTRQEDHLQLSEMATTMTKVLEAK